MRELLEKSPVTVVLLALTVLAAVAGGVVTVVEPDTLSFAEYLDRLEKFALALGILGVGRGIRAAGERVVQGQTLASLEGDPNDTRAHGA